MGESGTIVIIGRRGQLARELADLVWPTDCQPRFLGRGEIDLFDAPALASRLNVWQPRAIINTAAYTAVDLAESEPALAMQLNATMPATLADIACDMAIPFLHISSDYVFAGDRQHSYREDDVTAPASIYGQSKRAGEIAIQEAAARSVVVRTAGLFGYHGQNFLKTMIAKARSGSSQTVKVVHDQISTPTPTAALAAALQQMAFDMIGGRSLPPVLHFAGQPAVSWFDFTVAIFEALAMDGATDLPRLEPVTVSAFPRPAPRPAFSALDCRLAAELGYVPPDWRTALPSLVARLAKERIAA